jgi:transposase-like protein
LTHREGRDEREVVSYREGFKREIVEQVVRGKYPSLAEAGRRNSIRRAGTLVSMDKKIRAGGPTAPKRIKVETVQEAEELKAALVDAHMDSYLERAFLDIACERLGTTAEE